MAIQEAKSSFSTAALQANITFDFETYWEAAHQGHVRDFFWMRPAFIRELYLSVCCIPAASSEVERLFSAGGYIVSKRRARMLPVRFGMSPTFLGIILVGKRGAKNDVEI